MNNVKTEGKEEKKWFMIVVRLTNKRIQFFQRNKISNKFHIFNNSMYNPNGQNDDL